MQTRRGNYRNSGRENILMDFNNEELELLPAIKDIAWYNYLKYYLRYRHLTGLEDGEGE